MKDEYPIKVGDKVKRIWGDGYLETELVVTGIDDEFVYCGGENGWKFDRVYGVETDEEAGWGVATEKRPNLQNIVLTRIKPIRKEATG